MSFERPEFSENVESKEDAVSPDIDFLVTDHSLRYPERFSREQVREAYSDMRRHGLSSIRFDFDWDRMAKNYDEYDKTTADRYTDALQDMKEMGMKPASLVLSSPPEWAQELYKNDKEKYFQAYQGYLSAVAETIGRSGAKVNSVQLFNEINNSFIFQFIKIEDLPRCAEIARTTLQKVQPDIKLGTSLILGNFNEKIAEVKKVESIDTFIGEHGQMLKDNFDVLSVDYYPGMWHWPLGSEKSKITNLLGEGSFMTKIKNRTSDLEHAATPKHLNATFKNLEMLEKAFEQIAALGIDYEIGETGFPTNVPYSTEDRQRYFYDSFFRSFRQMLVDFKKRGIPLPKRVDLYESQDEENKGFGGLVDKLLKIPIIEKLSRATPNPEHNFGLKTKAGEPKSILKGPRYRADEELGSSELSQLQKIVRYVNRPIELSENQSDEESANE
jgi:hypothetical protein